MNRIFTSVLLASAAYGSSEADAVKAPPAEKAPPLIEVLKKLLAPRKNYEPTK